MSTAAATSAPADRSRGLHIALWIAQVLVAFLFLMAGFMKLSKPFAELNTMMPWTVTTGEPLVRFIGASELLGALGLLLPSVTRIKPKLTALAGVGLVTIMVLASIFHSMRGEFQVLPMNFALGGLAAFIAWGRFKKAPISPR